MDPPRLEFAVPNAVLPRFVTRSCTIPKLAHAGSFVGTADPEVLGVAAGAIRLIGRRAPGHDLAIAAMAVVAIECRSVISRVWDSGMVEVS